MKTQGRKKTWDDGSIQIKLENDQIQFRTGAVIRGRLLIS